MAAALRDNQPASDEVRRAGASRFRCAHVSLESLLWALLIVLATVSRFWDLSYRALMHDESLHAYYSWWLYRGHGYIHDPLMHGPFLFHVTALSDFLFGASDASSRYAPALAGILLVATPWLLRAPHLLGRWGSLAAGLFLLVSPSILYYTRFIRHDPFTLLGTLLLVVAIFRYIERPQRRWLVLGGAMLGVLYTNHEIVFAIVAIFVGVIAVGLLLTTLRSLLPPVVFTAVLAVVILAFHHVTPERFGAPLPAIPWNASSTNPSLQPKPENQRAFYHAILTNHFVLSLVTVVVIGLMACWLVTRKQGGVAANHRDQGGYRLGWVEIVSADASAGSFGAGFRNAWRDKIGLQMAFLLFVAICAVLFTAFFTKLSGLATATIATDGSLLYWLGQQGVRRGNQPWYYFLILAPQYEFIMLAFGLPMIGLTFRRALRDVFQRRSGDPRQRFRLFLSFWAIGITLALSYAGEKMPWLIIHIVLPMLLLAASLIDELIERWQGDREMMTNPAPVTGSVRFWSPARRRQSPWIAPTLTVSLLAAGAAWLLIAARLSSPRFVQQGDAVMRVPPADAINNWWQVFVPPLIALVLILIGIWVAGATRAARAAICALLLGLLLLQTHAAWRLSFEQGDVARDSLIYNTTTPDVQRMVSDLTQLSYAETGSLDLPITMNAEVEWPLLWYFRDFGGTTTSGPVTGQPQSAIYILAYDFSQPGAGERQSADRATLSANYTEQQYVLRWHEPESAIYRNFAIAPELAPSWSIWGSYEDPYAHPHGPTTILGSIWSSLMTQTTTAGQQRLWRLIFYREMPAGTLNFTYSLFIRNDLLPTYNGIHYDGDQYSRPNA